MDKHWAYARPKENVGQNRIFSPLCLIKTSNNKRTTQLIINMSQLAFSCLLTIILELETLKLKDFIRQFLRHDHHLSRYKAHIVVSLRVKCASDKRGIIFQHINFILNARFCKHSSHLALLLPRYWLLIFPCVVCLNSLCFDSRLFRGQKLSKKISKTFFPKSF